MLTPRRWESLEASCSGDSIATSYTLDDSTLVRYSIAPGPPPSPAASPNPSPSAAHAPRALNPSTRHPLSRCSDSGTTRTIGVGGGAGTAASPASAAVVAAAAAATHEVLRASRRRDAAGKEAEGEAVVAAAAMVVTVASSNSSDLFTSCSRVYAVGKAKGCFKVSQSITQSSDINFISIHCF
uniref:Uncharacterized protein n=1 Tax=Zea mays TaxID=4577 RepID=A0A804P8P0_MAIZE